MIIVDTSVAFKWFDESENDREIATSLLTDHLSKGQEILVPDLFFYEITNAWATKTALGGDEIKANLMELEKYALNVYPVNFAILQESSEISKEFHVSVYDATYAAIAQQGYILITADEKFVRKVDLKFVKSLREA